MYIFSTLKLPYFLYHKNTWPISLFILKEITNMAFASAHFRETIKGGRTRQNMNVLAKYTVSTQRMILCYFQHISIYYFLLPSPQRGGWGRCVASCVIFDIKLSSLCDIPFSEDNGSSHTFSDTITCA